MRVLDEKGIGYFYEASLKMKDEKTNSFQLKRSPSAMCTNTAHVASHSCSFLEEKDTLILIQDKDVTAIVRDLGNTTDVSVINNSR